MVLLSRVELCLCSAACDKRHVRFTLTFFFCFLQNSSELAEAMWAAFVYGSQSGPRGFLHEAAGKETSTHTNMKPYNVQICLSLASYSEGKTDHLYSPAPGGGRVPLVLFIFTCVSECQLWQLPVTQTYTEFIPMHHVGPRLRTLTGWSDSHQRWPPAECAQWKICLRFTLAAGFFFFK